MLSLIEQVQNTNAPDADRDFLALISVLPSLRLIRHTHPLYWGRSGSSKAPFSDARARRGEARIRDGVALHACAWRQARTIEEQYG